MNAKMSLPGLTRQSILVNRVCFLRWMRGSRLRQGFAGLRTHSAAEALAKAASPRMTGRFRPNADDRRRRVPAQRLRRGPRRRPDLDAVEFARLHLADVGAADARADAAVSRHPLRPPRPRQITGATRSLFGGTFRPR